MPELLLEESIAKGEKLVEMAEFCVTLGADGMDGISALNLATDVLAVLPSLLAEARGALSD